MIERRRVLPFAVFALTPFVVFPAAMLRNSLMDGHDDKLSNLPLLLHSARKLLAGEIFWTTDLWMGMPLLAEPEAATFYLPRLLLLVLPPALGYAVYVLLHFVLAQVSAYLYLRELRLSSPAATFGAIAYGFTGFMLGHAGHTMYVVAGAWAPLFLYFLHRATTGAGRMRMCLLGAALSFAAPFFAGAVQLSVYLLSLAGMLHVSLAVLTRAWRPIVAYVAGATAGVLAIAPQLLVSLDFTRSLATATRHDYAFSTALSFHPLLAATVVIPTRPLEYGEVYTRLGLVVTFAAATGALRLRKGTPIRRSWLIVFVVAFAMMLGKYLPPLAHVLHVLPGLDVLRGPVRHNFELGVAAAVLAAFGAEDLLTPGRRRDVVAAVFAVLTTLAALAMLFAARGGQITPEHGSLYTQIPRRVVPFVVAVPIVCTLVWLGVRWMARGRYAYAVPAVLCVAALGEARAAEQLDAWAFWDGGVRTGVPSARIGDAAFRRIITPATARADYTSFTDNAVLYVPGLQNLLGYSSIAPLDAVATFDLDMHGHPRLMDDLLWSPLPAIFGVTHVIMPHAICGTPALTVGSGDGEACVVPDGESFSVTHEERRCSIDLRTSATHYRLEGEVRRRDATGTGRLHVDFSSRTDGLGDVLAIPGPVLGTIFTPISQALDPGLADEGWLRIYAEGDLPLEVRNLRVSETDMVALAELVGPSPVRVTSSTPISRRIVLPPGATVYRLEVAARTTRGSPTLVVDLYDGPSFDPEEAQIARPRPGGAPSSVQFTLTPSPAHPSPLLRAFVDGEGEVEIMAARLLVEETRTIARLSPGEGARGNGFEWSGDDLELSGPGASMKYGVQLAVRPMVLDADVAPAEAPGDAVFGMGLAAQGAAFTYANESVAEGDALSRPTHLRRAVALPADAPSATLRAYGVGTRPVGVSAFAAHDGCALVRYEPVRAIDHGLWLNRTVDPFPRAYTVGEVAAVGSIEEARGLLRASPSPSFDPRRTALVQLDGAATPPGLLEGILDDVRFTGETVDMSVHAPDGPTFVVVNDRFDPRFVATVDDAPTRVFRTNAMVRGIFVPQGEHRLRLHYQPPGIFFVGLVAALLGLVLAYAVLPRVVERTPALAPERIDPRA